MLAYADFHRKKCVRLIQHLLVPPIHPLADFEFPRHAIYHVIDFHHVMTDPGSQDYFLRNIDRPLSVIHIRELKSLQGKPRNKPVNMNMAIRNFHAKNRRFRNLIDENKMPKDPFPVLINYGHLDSSVIYTQNFYANYYRFFNLNSTLWQTVNHFAGTTDRQQFVFIHLPDRLASLASCQRFSADLNQQKLSVFDSPEKLLQLELINWLNPDTQHASEISQIRQENLSRVNLVFLDGMHWCCLNLEDLFKWHSDTVDDHTKNQDLVNLAVVSHLEIQKRVMRLLLSLVELRVDTTEEPAEKTLRPQQETSEGEQIEIIESPIITADAEKPQEDLTAEENEDSLEILAKRAQKTLNQDLQQLEALEVREQEVQLDQKDILKALHRDTDAISSLKAHLDRLVYQGSITPAELKKITASLDNSKKLKSAYDDQASIFEHAQISSESLKVPDQNPIPIQGRIADPSMRQSSLINFDERFIRDIHPKLMTAQINALQKGGYILQEHRRQVVKQYLGDYELHTIKLKPLSGPPSTINLKIPVVNEQGNFKINGNQYKLKKQRVDAPIRKVSAEVVALSSYFCKLFVQRSPKKVSSERRFITDQLIRIGLDDQDPRVSQLKPGDCHDPDFEAPLIYNQIAQSIQSFSHKDLRLIFNRELVLKHFSPDDLKKYERGGVLCGYTMKNEPLLMDFEGVIHRYEKAQLVPMGSLYQILELSGAKPADFSELKVHGKYIPIGLVLGYYYGLDTLLGILKINPVTHPADTRFEKKPNCLYLRFSDVVLEVDHSHRLASLILSGFHSYRESIRHYTYKTFHDRNVYLNVFENYGITARTLIELDLLKDYFVDPTTELVLKEMNEPIVFEQLLIRSTELLLTASYPDLMDMRYMRIRGYERFSGALYNQMVNAIRQQKAKSIGTKLELSPYAVWTAIATDPSVAIFDEVNPIEDMKQIEAVTFSGTGGRMKRAMTKSSRAYHPNDLGTISEATKDSGDVAINTYLSADPKFNSLLGTTSAFDPKTDGITRVLSSSSLLSVAATHDDPKRTSFISIFHGHGVSCPSYHVPRVRTGYEEVIAQRTTSTFALSAKQKGKVTSRNSDGLVVTYEDGTTQAVRLGTKYGNAAGSTYPHEIVSNLKVGASFDTGAILAYNTGFFEPDYYNPSNVIYKGNLTVTVALLETKSTFEDSCAVSRNLSKKLTTKIVQKRMRVIDFDQHLIDVVEPGTTVSADSVLCYIEDQITARNKIFKAQDYDTLRLLKQQSPRAEYPGTVDRVEVFYHGDLKDMSPSLRALASQSDEALSRRTKAEGIGPFIGQVDESYRVEGNPLMENTAVVIFYIVTELGGGVGDKLVFSLQLKSIIAEVMEYDMTTQSGVVIDAQFGQRSVFNRIVTSAYRLGMANRLVAQIEKLAIQAYEKD